MTIERVEWQYVEGTRSLHRLTVMLAKACEDAGFVVDKASAHGYQGWRLRDTPFWVVSISIDPKVLLSFMRLSTRP